MAVEKISDVPVGAILARPVEDSMGRILINAGEALTEQLIAVLVKRGFAEVEIRPGAPSIPGRDASVRRVSTKLGVSEEQIGADQNIARIREDIAARFATVRPLDRPMTALRNAVEHVLIERHVRRRGRA